MKIENEKLKIPVFAVNVLLVTCAVFCTLGVLISAFDFEVDMSLLLFIILVSSAAVVLLVMLFRWRGILIVSVPAFAVFIWNFARITDDFRWVVYSITFRFNEWTPVPVIFPEISEYAEPPVFFFAFLAIALVLLLYVTICLRQSTWLTVLATLPLVFLSFILTNTPPGIPFILGLAMVYLAILICGALQPDEYEKSIATFAASLGIAVVFTGIVYSAASPSRFAEAYRIGEIRSYVHSITEQIEDMISRLTGEQQRGSVNSWPGHPDAEVWSFNINNVNIADAGTRYVTGKALVEITSSDAGTYYLRGFSMGDFDGRAWKSTTTVEAEVSSGYTLILDDDEEIVLTRDGDLNPVRIDVPFRLSSNMDSVARGQPATVATNYFSLYYSNAQEDIYPPLPRYTGMSVLKINDITNVVYRPYYWDIGAYGYFREYFPEIRERLEDYDMQFFYVPGSVRDYITEETEMSDMSDMQLFVMPENFRISIDGFGHEIDELMYVGVFDKINEIPEFRVPFEKMYTTIDEDTAEGLRQIAIDAGIDPDSERAEIADAVAEFIRSSGRYTLTPAVIPEDEDFALYFLQTAREGYCIHFATAATLMLRSLDVPARFTSGYVARVTPEDAGRPVTLTDGNAHAWVEVLYDDIGWLPLEVTPSGRGSYVPEPQRHVPTPQQLEDTPPSSEDEESDADTQRSQRQGGTASAGVQSLINAKWFVQSLQIVSVLVVLIATVLIRRKLARYVREKRFTQTDTNAAVICMWKHVLKVQGRQGLPPSDIEELALKARFSQHKMSEEERSYMLNYTHRLAAEIYEGAGEFMRLWLKYIRTFK